MDRSPFVAGARAQGWAMLAVLAVGFGLGVATLAAPGPARRIAATLTPGAFLGGQTAAAVNDAMAHDLPIGAVLSAAGGVLRWRVFGSGGPQVTVGCGGWLFLTEELRPWPGSDAAMQARAQAAARRGERAGRAGDRAAGGAGARQAAGASARPGACGAACPMPRRRRRATPRFLGLLGGLPVVDLLATYAGIRTPLYYRTDTHWNQDGAALAAAATAATATRRSAATARSTPSTARRPTAPGTCCA